MKLGTTVSERAIVYAYREALRQELEQEGYTVAFEQGMKGGWVADLVAEKPDSMLVYEFGVVNSGRPKQIARLRALLKEFYPKAELRFLYLTAPAAPAASLKGIESLLLEAVQADQQLADALSQVDSNPHIVEVASVVLSLLEVDGEQALAAGSAEVCVEFTTATPYREWFPIRFDLKLAREASHWIPQVTPQVWAQIA